MSLPRTVLARAIEQIPDRQQLAVQATSQQTRDAVNARGPLGVSTGPQVFASSGATVTVNHRLGRTPTGWRVTDITGGYGPIQRVSWDALRVTFQAFTACTATFEVW